jgi:hypothetical protein
LSQLSSAHLPRTLFSWRMIRFMKFANNVVIYRFIVMYSNTFILF